MTTELKPLTGAALAAAAAEEVMPGKCFHIHGDLVSWIACPIPPGTFPEDTKYVIYRVNLTDLPSEVFLVINNKLGKRWRPDRDIAAAMEVLQEIRRRRELWGSMVSELDAIALDSGDLFLTTTWLLLKADLPPVITRAALEAVRRTEGAKP